MLTKEEETKLEGMVVIISNARVRLNWPILEDCEWLVTRLKEVNDECSKVTAELQKVNEELARVYEVYGP